MIGIEALMSFKVSVVFDIGQDGILLSIGVDDDNFEIAVDVGVHGY